MVNGYETTLSRSENGHVQQDDAAAMQHQDIVEGSTTRPKTTTIGTIALQSGDTRLVIALLEVRAYYIYTLLLPCCMLIGWEEGGCGGRRDWLGWRLFLGGEIQGRWGLV